MGMTYVIADLHGRRDLLDAALGGIEMKEGDNNYKIVFLGDYVDRGPNSCGVLERLIAGPKKENATWVCLKGNHDSMLSWVCRNVGPTAKAWSEDYAHHTFASYPEGIVPKEHLDWIDALPLYHEDAHRIYVHAGIHPGLPLDKQREDMLLWFRYPDDFDKDYNGKHIVHGHTAKKKGPVRLQWRSNYDTAAWNTGRLVVGGFDDAIAGGAVTFFEIVGPKHEKGGD